MLIDGKTINFQVDSGASVNIISKNCLKGTTYTTTKNPKTLLMWNKSTLQAEGVCKLKLLNPKLNKKYSLEFVVVNNDLTPLLGSKASQQMDLITVNSENFHKAHINKVSTSSDRDKLPEKR